jgi:hypothetical protein
LTPELLILKLFFKYELYQKYFKAIDLAHIRTTYKELYLLYQALSSFMGKHKRDTTCEELQVYFLTVYPAEKREVYNVLFDSITISQASEEIIGDLVQKIAQRKLLQNLAVKAFEASEGHVDMAKVHDAFSEVLESSEFDSTAQLTVVNFISDDLNVLYNEVFRSKGLRWRLKSLNQSLGSLRKGDFGFIFARPESGKTTFLASECTGFAGQTDRPIIWFNNEEQGQKVMIRCYQAALGLRLEQLLSNIKDATKKFHEITKGNIKIYDQARIDRSEAERIISANNPALVVFDQIDKIIGFAADRNDLELGEIYNWAREMAKSHCPVIGVCQADGTGEGQRWLTMSHVSNAKTSKQAEADWILGIGRQNSEDYESVRHFHVSKNKLLGDDDSISELRHGRWDVKILPDVARYEDFLK